jgi:hypothetical protein
MKLPFNHDGRQLEVQAVAFDGVWLLSVHENGRPAGDLQYQVDGSAEIGVEGSDLLDRLMAIVAEDFCKSSDRAKAAEQAITAEKVVDFVSNALKRTDN